MMQQQRQAQMLGHRPQCIAQPQINRLPGRHIADGLVEADRFVAAKPVSQGMALVDEDTGDPAVKARLLLERAALSPGLEQALLQGVGSIVPQDRAGRAVQPRLQFQNALLKGSFVHGIVLLLACHCNDTYKTATAARRSKVI